MEVVVSSTNTCGNIDTNIRHTCQANELLLGDVAANVLAGSILRVADAAHAEPEISKALAAQLLAVLFTANAQPAARVS